MMWRVIKDVDFAVMIYAANMTILSTFPWLVDKYLASRKRKRENK